MSQGFMVHAYNNCDIDYGLLALCCCLLIKKHLAVNNTVLISSEDTLDWLQQTQDHDLIDYAFDYIKITDRNWSIPTRQFNDTQYTVNTVLYDIESRFNSFTLTPFDETILLDADFLILDQSIDTIWGCKEDLLINKKIIDLNLNQTTGKEFAARFNKMRITRYWSSIMYFKMTTQVQSLFELTKFIKENYPDFQMFHNSGTTEWCSFDSCLSVAIHMLNSQLEIDNIKPFSVQPLLTATEMNNFIDFRESCAVFTNENHYEDSPVYKVSSNVHVMNKWAMLRMSDRIIKYARPV